MKCLTGVGYIPRKDPFVARLFQRENSDIMSTVIVHSGERIVSIKYGGLLALRNGTKQAREILTPEARQQG